jgi:nuclear transport factor 2 (NTF2) superfamily protein
VGGVTLRGAAEVARFLHAKFARQRDAHCAFSLFVAEGSRVAAHALSEWRTAAPADADGAPLHSGGWWRTRCNDLYEFNDDGRILHHDSAANDVPIAEGERALRDRAAQFAALAEQQGLLLAQHAAAPAATTAAAAATATRARQLA